MSPWTKTLRSPQTVAGRSRALRSADQPSITVTSNFDRALWLDRCFLPPGSQVDPE